MSGKIDLSEDLPELRARFAAHDFFVDFLGGLVPGLLFLLGLGLAFVPISAVLVSPRASPDALAIKVLQATQGTPATIWVAAFFVLVMVAYVVGHLFYRRTPKIPDQRSFKRLLKAEARDQRGDLEHLRSEYGCSTEKECEFPYTYLHEYLAQRGHHHLLVFVTWKENFDIRSKTYINVLKTRLRYHYPEKCSEIIRNEAHVRLASSTWYVARALRFFCVVTAFLLIILLIYPGLERGLSGRFVIALFAFPISVFALAWTGKRRIEYFLHYQRLREIFYVLETAYIAFRDQPEILDPPFTEFAKAVRESHGVEADAFTRTAGSAGRR